MESIAQGKPRALDAGSVGREPLEQPDGYQIYLPYVGNAPPPFRWGDGYHAITFPIPDDRPRAASWIRAMNWYDWGASDNRPDRLDELYLNMVWSQKAGQKKKSFLDPNRPLLLLNEPDIPGQAEMTPEETARALEMYRDYPGELYAMGLLMYNIDYWHRSMEAYRDLYGREARWDGIHLHVYWEAWKNTRELLPILREWRKLAAGKPILVTEWNIQPIKGDMSRWWWMVSELGGIILEELEPRKMFYFSYRMPDRFAPWDKTSMARELGQAWLRYMDIEGYPVQMKWTDGE